jgi:hypothetical protein
MANGYDPEAGEIFIHIGHTETGVYFFAHTQHDPTIPDDAMSDACCHVFNAMLADGRLPGPDAVVVVFSRRGRRMVPVIISHAEAARRTRFPPDTLRSVYLKALCEPRPAGERVYALIAEIRPDGARKAQALRTYTDLSPIPTVTADAAQRDLAAIDWQPSVQFASCKAFPE